MCPTCNGKRKIHDSDSISITYHGCPTCGPDTRSVYEKYPEIMAAIAEWEKKECSIA